MKRLPITGNYPVVGSLCTSIELCIHINADARFQFNCDAVIPDGYLFTRIVLITIVSIVCYLH